MKMLTLYFNYIKFEALDESINQTLQMLMHFVQSQYSFEFKPFIKF